ncbi:chemotaxis signal transduction protein [Pandoraea terrae]|uniref:Chemotaxis protein CheW n=1 Tax=Pandoraea terrae TaxID=1537710 RepID=A0A5E4TGD6_9BURK|nr:chemotaxis protein CheW [Pandoraea terrae]VVD86033.1 chemotaxis signal transduction protein [Pandoraea terrae]
MSDTLRNDVSTQAGDTRDDTRGNGHARVSEGNRASRDPADLLDRLPLEYADPAPWRDPVAPIAAERAPSLLVFRIGMEWLALPAAAIAEVAEMRRWHTLPRKQQRHLLGLVNLRGALMPCVALGELLGVTQAPAESSGNVNGAPGAAGAGHAREGHARLLTLRYGGHITAFPVSEIFGTIAPAAQEFLAAPATTPGAAAGFASTVVRWRDHVVGVLDPARVSAAFDRSLA